MYVRSAFKVSENGVHVRCHVQQYKHNYMHVLLHMTSVLVTSVKLFSDEHEYRISIQ